MTAFFDAESYRPLPEVYKGRYPFRLAVPSFVYPDTWSVNARLLGAHVDEIELLFFESKPEGCLPTREEIETLSRISEELCLAYNIHLPTDVSLAASGGEGRAEAIDALRRVIDLTFELDPASYTLHIPFDASGRTGMDVSRWQERARQGGERLLASGIPSRRLAVENLDYPFEWMRDLVRELDLSICMDVGHLLLEGADIDGFYRENADRIAVLHLHGACGGKDHLPLTALSQAGSKSVAGILKSFSASLSLEVFSYANLVPSLAWLEKAVNGER